MLTILLNSWIFYSILSAIPLIYWYLTRNHNFWVKQGIKGPKPKIGVGNLFDLTSKPELAPAIERKWLETYGKIYGHFEGNKPILTVAEPELIKQICIKDFNQFADRRDFGNIAHPIADKNILQVTGDDWKRIRSIASPTFTSGKMKIMYPKASSCLKEFLDILENYAKTNEDINIKTMYGNFTMDVISSCAFATKTNTHKDPNNEIVISARNIFNPSSWKMLSIFLLPKFINDLLNYKSVFDEKSLEFFFKLTQHLMNERRNDKKEFNDFLQLLMNSEADNDSKSDENDLTELHHVNEGEEELAAKRKAMTINGVQKRLTEDEILAQTFLFFAAGYETTGSTLTFATYELTINPEIQERLYKEVISAVDANGELDYYTLSKLEYLDAVISETLRLHPPILRLQRKATNNYRLGGKTGIIVEKEQIVEIPIYAIHMCEEYYPNADQFIPERFLPENRHKITPYTYLPFGAGPRNCIGMRFALLEAKLGLAQTVRQFKFVRSAQTDVPFIFNSGFADSQSMKRLIIKLEKR